ncbi:unnamed protein product [Mytilus edulis]|uniref:Reverse transcriptase domain-containing protein n=1 Tax=Mytilus edulis TaxID=6550 RepID=A0A8S3VI18_MYTED|nr:unnamed protein product [Mytilus edulis]
MRIISISYMQQALQCFRHFVGKFSEENCQLVKDLFAMSTKSLDQVGRAGAFHHMIKRKCAATDAGINNLKDIQAKVLYLRLSDDGVFGQGDLNEDLGNDERQNKRKKYLQQLIEDYRLGYENTGKTFIKTNGQECSELDYFLYKSRHMEMAEKEVLKDVISNHSDHYPIKCEVKIGIPKRGTNQNSKLQQLQPTIKWDKVDQDLYLAIINRQVDTMAESPAETADDAELLISKMHQMLTNAANESSSNKSKYKAKPKLKVWTPIIKSSLKEMRKCYDIWSRNGKPTNPDDKSYQDRVNSRKEFKKQVKVEQARERDREKQEILEARTRDKAIIRDRIQPRVLKDQNPTQRGFTAKSSPLNAGLVVEEVYRESVDSNQEFELVLLDAKSAFDVVVHSHLMRRLFHCGIDDTLWRIIQSMHWQSTSAIKWEGMIADEFPVSQGVRQGGILSTDLYKVYVNPLLNRLQQSGLGCKIGNVLCNTTACADDIALLGKKTT